MTTPTFNITDADIQASLQIIDSQASTMRTTISNVGSIGGNIATAYQSSTSKRFHDQLNEWGEIYNQLITTFGRVYEDLRQANAGVARANDDSDQMTTSLSGNISGILAG